MVAVMMVSGSISLVFHDKFFCAIRIFNLFLCMTVIMEIGTTYFVMPEYFI